MKAKISTVFFILGLIISSSGYSSLNGQSPYTLHQGQELKIIGLGLGLKLSGAILRMDIDPYSVGQLENFNVQAIPGIDRFATGNYSPGAAKQSDLTRNIGLALPFALLATRAKSDLGQVGLLLGETYLLVSGITNTVKAASGRARPFVYHDDAPLSAKRNKNAQLSFFSGHTSMTSGFSFFAAKVFSDFYPESRLKPLVWTVAATIPALTGYYRVKAGKHFPSDVIAGYAVGALGGILIPALHKTNRKSSYGGLSLTSSGADVSLVYRF